MTIRQSNIQIPTHRIDYGRFAIFRNVAPNVVSEGSGDSTRMSERIGVFVRSDFLVMTSTHVSRGENGYSGALQIRTDDNSSSSFHLEIMEKCLFKYILD